MPSEKIAFISPLPYLSINKSTMKVFFPSSKDDFLHVSLHFSELSQNFESAHAGDWIVSGM